MYRPAPAPDTALTRDDVILSYIENQVTYLSLIHPDLSRDELTNMVKDVVRTQVKRPTARCIVYPEVGNTALQEVDLLDLTRKYRDKVIAPSGTFYEELEKVEGGNSIAFSVQCGNNRTMYKKKMFTCMEVGNTLGSNMYNSLQALAKILVNSLPGGHGFLGNPFYDLECYNAITSTGRNGIVMCYAIAEQFIASNYAFTSQEEIIQYTTILASRQQMQEQIEAVIRKHDLTVPTTEVLLKSLTNSTKYYRSLRDIKKMCTELKPLFDNLADWQKVYIFYRRNFRNLLFFNQELWRSFCTELFALDKECHEPGYAEKIAQIDPKDAKKIPDDAAAMLAVMFSEVLEKKTASAKTIADFPDIARKYVDLYIRAEHLIEQVNDIFTAFLYSGEFLLNIPKRQAMIRKACGISDTDSILYTVHPLVSWWTDGDLRLTKSGLNMAAFSIWLLGQVLDAANRDMSIVRGITTEKRVVKLHTKYEFLYSAVCRTNKGKHYFALCLAKEGRIYKEAELDVKGVGFQSSNVPEVSRKFTKDTLKEILVQFTEKGTVSSTHFIEVCMAYEKVILDSLLSGELHYYGNVPVRNESEYANPSKSVYFNYQMWEKVYAPTYGSIFLPGKYTAVPFKESVFRDPTYIDYCHKVNPDVCERLVTFLSELRRTSPGKKITRIVLPIAIQKLPEIFIPAVNIRSIIFKNLTSIQLGMEQIGVDLGPAASQPLYLDYYTNLRLDQMQIQK